MWYVIMYEPEHGRTWPDLAMITLQFMPLNARCQMVSLMLLLHIFVEIMMVNIMPVRHGIVVMVIVGCVVVQCMYIWVVVVSARQFYRGMSMVPI